jgi:hypothetical protein
VGRLENIVSRNQRRNRLPERVIVSMVVGAIVLLIVFLTVFTDLGLPAGARDVPDVPPGPPRQAPAAEPRDGQRVDGVLLRRAPVRPAPAPGTH